MRPKRIFKAFLAGIYLILGTLKGLTFWIRGKNKDKFMIKANYLVRRNNRHFDDTGNADEYQNGVYRQMKLFFDSKNLNSIIDIGCGSGFKLMKYFSDDKTLGLEVPPALDHLRAKYPDRTWAFSDFNQAPIEKHDMVIAIDVVEHLHDPGELLRYIKRLRCKYVGLSTPDRSRMSLRSKVGPPVNPAHVREWTKKEFDEYVSSFFEIIVSEVVEAHDHYVIAVNGKQSHDL